jgi:catechol 2,3-dioxygenase-like lactoylglutathione lyase family enzyme
LVIALSIGLTGPLSAQRGSAPPAGGALLQTTGAFFALSVADVQASARWYTEKLGLQAVMNVPHQAETKSAVIVLRGGGLTVELVQHDDARPLRTAAPAAKGDPVFVHGIFKAGVVVRDFDATVAQLRSRGVEIAMGPWPARADQPANLIIKDNAGNLIQIFGA